MSPTHLLTTVKRKCPLEYDAMFISFLFLYTNYRLSDCELADSAVVDLYDILSGHRSLNSLRYVVIEHQDLPICQICLRSMSSHWY